MKLISHLLIVLTTTLVVACGGASSQADQHLGVMDDITAVLKGVKDVDSATAAKSKLEPLMIKMVTFAKNAEGAADAQWIPDAEEVKKITEATKTYSEEMVRILMNPELQPILTEVLNPKTD